MKNNCAFAFSGLSIVFATVLLAGCASKTPAPVYERGAQTLSAPMASAVKDTYTVKSGDTLYSIAREHGMDHRELISLNAIENPNQINVGRVLKIRSQGATSSLGVSTAPITSDVVVSRPIGSEPVSDKRSQGTSDTFKREPKGGKEPYSDQALAQAQGQGQVKPDGSVAPPVAKTEAALAGNEVSWIWPASGKVIGTFSEGGSKGVDIAGKVGDPVVAVGDGKVLVANKYTDTTLRSYGNMVVIKHDGSLITVYAYNSKLLVKADQTVTKGQKIAEMGNPDADHAKLHFEVRRLGKPVDPLKYLPVR